MLNDDTMESPSGGMRMGKNVMHRSNGVDQLGQSIGLPRSGDVHKVHVRGYYLAHRPLFTLLGKKYFEKERRVEFLNTHNVGDTAFVCIHVGMGGGLSSSISILSKDDNDTANASGGTLGRLLQTAATGMMLGETSVFTYDVALAPVEERRSLFDADRICLGYLGPIGEDATKLLLEVDSFRIEREGKDQHRQVRNSGSRSLHGMGAVG